MRKHLTRQIHSDVKSGAPHSSSLCFLPPVICGVRRLDQDFVKVRHMKKTDYILLILFAMLLSNTSAQQQIDQTNRGRLLWSAFACATYAELSGKMEEQQRLFEIGYTVGKAFLTDIDNQTISESELQNAPVGVLGTLGGPTIEFILGRIFALVQSDSYDSVVKEDSRGMPIFNPADWADEELEVVRAQTKYRDSNCELIQ